MKKLFLILFIIAQASSIFAQNQADVVKDLVIKNVSVISMLTNDIKEHQDVVIKDGKISSISNTKKGDYKNVLIVDGKGKYMMPSLADAHVHFPEDDTGMKRVMALYLVNGVTKLRSMRGDWEHIDWRNKYEKDGSVHPKLYLSPPAISRNYDLSVSQIEEFVKTSKERGFNFMKILSIKDETVFAQFDSIAKEYNFPIGGHFPDNIGDDLIFNSLYNSFEHLGGLAGNPDVLESRLKLIKEKNIFICPTLSWYNIGSGRHSYDELRKLPGMASVPNATLEVWIDGTKKYREKLGIEAYKEEVANELKALDKKYEVIKAIHKLGIPMLLSPDSSSKYMISGFDMVGEMELLKHADLTNYEILKMATINFANFFNEDYGVIEKGKAADFIILKTNPLVDLNALRKIEGLYFNNQFLDRKKLETMRMSLLENFQN
ncbi:MAG: amidohydrolase family protein [Gelidibacter sp.]